MKIEVKKSWLSALILLALAAALGITPEQVPGYIAAEVAQAGCGAET